MLLPEIAVEAEIVSDAPGQTAIPSNRRLLLVFGVISLAVLFVCGGCGGFIYYTVWMLENVPFVDDPDEDWDSIYEVVGTKGKGRFYVYEFLGMHLRVQLRTANGKWELLDEEDEADARDAEMEDDAEEEFGLSEFPDIRQQGLGAPPEAGIGSEN